MRHQFSTCLTAPVLLFALRGYQASAQEAERSIVRFRPPRTALDEGLTAAEAAREQAYLSLPPETRKALEKSMVVNERLGLSSTGWIQLIGVYNLLAMEDRSKGKQIYHFIQTDLGGGRLFWSILFDVRNSEVRVLYRADGAEVPKFVLPKAGK